MSKSDGTIHQLVPSTNRGRYALDDPQYGHDLTSGEPIAIQLAGRWITGRVEHATSLSNRLVEGTYATQDVHSQLPLVSGYYFISSAGNSICGLCVGMKVKQC